MVLIFIFKVKSNFFTNNVINKLNTDNRKTVNIIAKNIFTLNHAI